MFSPWMQMGGAGEKKMLVTREKGRALEGVRLGSLEKNVKFGGVDQNRV